MKELRTKSASCKGSLYSILYNATTLTNAAHTKYMGLSVILCCFFFVLTFFSHKLYKRKSDDVAFVVPCSSSKKKVYSLHEYMLLRYHQLLA